jgi:aspartate racemase
MKTIGLIGGMSWESSSVYYTLINRDVQRRLGGMHSGKILLYSFDFGEMAALQAEGRWDEATRRMKDVGEMLAEGGSHFLAICCNTMHLMADEVERASGVPLLHIADPLAHAIRAADMRRVGLLGSRFTMDDGRVIRARLSRFGIETIIPDAPDHGVVDRTIYEELVRGKFLDQTRELFRGIIARLVARGAEGIILGCTELPLLVKPEDATVPLFDTTTLHATAIVDRAVA